VLPQILLVFECRPTVNKSYKDSLKFSTYFALFESKIRFIGLGIRPKCPGSILFDVFACGNYDDVVKHPD